jgi:hypothetical protein
MEAYFGTEEMEFVSAFYSKTRPVKLHSPRLQKESSSGYPFLALADKLIADKYYG